MRTKAKTKTYTTRYDDSYFRLINELVQPRLCASSVRLAFDIGRAKRVEFVVTNSKPKRLGGWHILHKRKQEHWKLTSATNTDYSEHAVMVLLYEASSKLNEDFPNNTTLYVCAY